ncbi:hypothetical protein RDI58_013465 [Solanum bulbocastanum]|uniref:Uncharacterized protein n=1 Tax=Solanum bulbocastanum TaxID=147425 RepID=A0AAN8TKY7_SOLBU
MIPSTVDPDATGFVEKENKGPKRPVKINAWKLAKLDCTDPLLLLVASPTSSLLRDVKQTSVVWDQEARRYVSVPISTLDTRTRPPMQGGSSNPNVASSINDKRPALIPQEPSYPSMKRLVEHSEKLMYAGESIFFGGPLLHGPIKDELRNERGSGSKESRERQPFNLPHESRFRRDAASYQLPLFVLGDFGSNK